jgi:hypothetical protein
MREWKIGGMVTGKERNVNISSKDSAPDTLRPSEYSYGLSCDGTWDSVVKQVRGLKYYIMTVCTGHFLLLD